jgi:hypothetical protein
MPKGKGPVYRVTLRALPPVAVPGMPPPPAPTLRLRSALKVLLRRFDLRAECVEELPEDGERPEGGREP